MSLEPKNLGQQGGESNSDPSNGQQQQQQNGGGAQDGGERTQDQPTAERPGWLPENYWDPATKAIKPEFESHFAELSTAHQARQDFLAKLPKTPAEYKFELAEDLELPEGITRDQIAVDENNPRFQAMREVLHGAQVEPEVANKLYGLYVQEQANQVAAINKRVGEEQTKLGANFGERIANVGTFLKGRLGDEMATALVKGIFTADQVKAYEKLAALFTNQGAAPITPKGDEGRDNPGKIEGWEKMSFEEKRAHQQARAAR